MSNPTVSCSACDRQRDCLKHLKAELPPRAAQQWLRRHCPLPICQFDFHYRAGSELPAPPRGTQRAPASPLPTGEAQACVLPSRPRAEEDGRTRLSPRGRPRRPLPVPEAEARQTLATQRVREAGTVLGMSPAQVYIWRRRLGIDNPHLPHKREHTYQANAKGLTWAVVASALRAHPHGLSLRTLARQVGCSHQAVWLKLVRLERRGLVRALRQPSGRRKGWVLAGKEKR